MFCMVTLYTTPQWKADLEQNSTMSGLSYILLNVAIIDDVLSSIECIY